MSPIVLIAMRLHSASEETRWLLRTATGEAQLSQKIGWPVRDTQAAWLETNTTPKEYVPQAIKVFCAGTAS